MICVSAGQKHIAKTCKVKDIIGKTILLKSLLGKVKHNNIFNNFEINIFPLPLKSLRG